MKRSLGNTSDSSQGFGVTGDLKQTLKFSVRVDTVLENMKIWSLKNDRVASCKVFKILERLDCVVK